MKKQELPDIDKSKFEFVGRDKKILDAKLDTKPVGYIKDVWRRFKKNKASVVAAIIIVLLLMFAILVPFFSPYNVSFAAADLNNALPKLFNSGTGFWDGTGDETISELEFNRSRAKGAEYEWQNNIVKPSKDAGVGIDSTRNYITKIHKIVTTAEDQRLFHVNRDSYMKAGFIYKQVPYNTYVEMQEYQDRTGIRLIYPMVDYSGNSGALNVKDANYWFKYTAVKDQAGIEASNTVSIKYDSDGNFVPNYAIYKTGTLSNYRAPYNSIRQAGDPGIDEGGDVSGLSYAYARLIATDNLSAPIEKREMIVRLNYYDYFVYLYGREPAFLFGLTGVGRDLFVCLAYGARLSFLLAILIASINLMIGAILGSIMGYYGGWVDLILQRIMDILAAVPFMVTIVLFQLHIQSFVGVFGTIIFAFIFTGWIGMADRVRAQFYRYKGHEYVLASRTLGARDRRLMFRHIFPNAMGTIITGSILMIPGVVFQEATLSYLGIINLDGPSATSLGTLLSQAQGSLVYFPHNIFFPAIFISLLMIAFNLFGNGLRDAFNPSLRGAED